MATKNRDGRNSEYVGVKELPTQELKPNPHNPRMLFDRAPLDTLRKSIAKVGILVPLTVYREESTSQYVILDGQRRWTCACELELDTVPVNVVREPTLVENIVTMFQIHKLREDWELMPTALKLEVLMKELQERSEKTLAELTGLDQAVVSRCKKLLSYPKKYQDMMLDADPGKRQKADFFIELYTVRNDRVVNAMDWYKKDRFTQQMLDKYKARTLKAVTDFRVVKQHIRNAAKAGKTRIISNKLRQFAEDPSIPVSHLEIESANVKAEARSVKKDAEKLSNAISTLDLEAFFGEESMWDALSSLSRQIQELLRKLGRRKSE